MLQAYDSHCNLVMSDVTETVYFIDEEDEDEDDVLRVSYEARNGSRSLLTLHLKTIKKQAEMLFVRGVKNRELTVWTSS